jgi:hypothetical protein
MMRMGSWMKWNWVLLVVAAMMAGCETSSLNDEGTITLAELQGVTPAPPPDTGGNTGGDTGGDASGDTDGDADGDTGTGGTGGGGTGEITGSIKWLGTDVSGWAQTASLKASVGGGTINMPYDKAKVWPTVDGVNANCWAIANIDGQWYAATFEYLRPGQTSKPVGVLDGSKGDHFKVSPMSSWRPSSGERFGIMVSGLARGGLRNVKERSNISMVTWP